MTRTRIVSCTTILLVVVLTAQLSHAGEAGTASDVVFTDYSPLSSNAELARRFLSPLTAAKLPELLAQSGKALKEQPVDLTQEKFRVYVPAQAPPHGYGLIVFVPPWDDARVPDEWGAVLDQYGIIFVSEANAGNDASVLARREPLALLAEQNVVKRYPVDPDRIYIAGFSGGSRVAMRIALAYPDIFRGAILNAGSDPIGGAETPLPSKDLFYRFQSATRIVHVTGEQDTQPLMASGASMRSMREWCVFNVESHVTPGAYHVSASATALSRALDALAVPLPPESPELASCRAGIEAELSADLKQAQSSIAAGNRDAAQDLLKKIDARYGGLAAPESVDLANQIGLK